MDLNHGLRPLWNDKDVVDMLKCMNKFNRVIEIYLEHHPELDEQTKIEFDVSNSQSKLVIEEIDEREKKLQVALLGDGMRYDKRSGVGVDNLQGAAIDDKNVGCGVEVNDDEGTGFEDKNVGGGVEVDLEGTCFEDEFEAMMHGDEHQEMRDYEYNNSSTNSTDLEKYEDSEYGDDHSWMDIQESFEDDKGATSSKKRKIGLRNLNADREKRKAFEDDDEVELIEGGEQGEEQGFDEVTMVDDDEEDDSDIDLGDDED
ncbi:hypothetical protein LOK49_LG12G02564 [Camellia lanceoleosa]|uniref:Uncharacterized protein n=1 Tax=Camellia lanceoleosa TaxID=1840588 RepID=A0ACC0FWX3_9ERIC|nr:hypothetical protein LOK49_LG12G02564 [Camellia lanceoleosa]